MTFNDNSRDKIVQIARVNMDKRQSQSCIQSFQIFATVFQRGWIKARWMLIPGVSNKRETKQNCRSLEKH